MVVKPEEMINGEIYYVKSCFSWIVRFKEMISPITLKGYSISSSPSFYLDSTIDPKSIRLATSEERDRLINKEIKHGFKWADNVPRETIIEIY